MLKQYQIVRLFLGLLIFNFCFQAFSQQQLYPLHPVFELDRFYNGKEKIEKDSAYAHTGFKPILESRVKQESIPFHTIKKNDERSWTARKLFLEHFIQVKNEEIEFTVDPLVNFEFGEDFSSEAREVNHYKNMRGFVAQVNFGSQVSVRTSFRENQAILPNYLNDRTKSTDVAYGQGRVKQFDNEGFDFAMASSYLSYSPSQKVNLQLGTGKHFIGNGHRSLLLSDWTFNYPYFKSDLLLFKGKVNYQNLFALFQNLERLAVQTQSENLFERKAGAFHYLNFAFSKRWSIALFEGFISPLADSSGSSNPSVSYYMPVIFLNHFINKDETTGNSVLGIDWKGNPIKGIYLYGQFASNHGQDELAYQFGVNYFLPMFPIRLRLEYNQNAEKPGLFTHYNESLTSPAPFNSEEYHASALMKRNRWLSEVAFNRQTNKSVELNFLQMTQGYIVNPINQLTLTAGYQMRSLNTNYPETNYFFVGLRTNLQSLYFDY